MASYVLCGTMYVAVNNYLSIVVVAFCVGGCGVVKSGFSGKRKACICLLYLLR